MYAPALLSVLAFLATANAVAIDRSGSQAAAVDKRACTIGLGGFCIIGSGGTASSSSSSAAASSTSSVPSSSSSKAATSTSASSSSSSSATSSTSTTSAKASTTSSAGNVVESVVSVPVAIVSQVITCPFGVIPGLDGLCGSGNGASSSSSASASSTSKAATSASASSSAGGNIISSVVAVPSAVVSQVVAPAASSVSSVIAPVASSVSSVVAPVASSVSSVVAPVASSVSSVVAPVASSVSSVVAPVASSVSSVVAPVASSVSSVVAPVASSVSSVVAPVASSVSSVVAPAASSVSSVVAPAASSASSIIASVSASSAKASSSSSAVVSVTPTTTSTSTTPSATPSPANAAVSGWKYANCVAEGTSGRALTGSTFAGSSMTVESCLASCDAAGFPLAGLEYSSECYCGSTLSNGASLSKTGTCAMTCSGNPGEICGGSATLSLYVSTKSNAAGLSSDYTSQTVALPAGWSSTTCMQEVSGRAFTKKSTASDDMTIQKCLSFCGDSKYAGLEYGRECYCADTLSNGASLTSTSSQCNTPCAGSASTTCGGPSAVQVYTNANFKSSSSGAYTNTGCVQEVDGRLLRGASIAGDNMTIETCTNFCQAQGMSIAATEYGRECYCGNSYTSTPLQSGQCNMPCAGNGAQNCGGPNALNVFTLGA